MVPARDAMSRAPSRLDEFGLIERYFAPLAADAPGAFGLTDDAAIVASAPGEQVVVTTDAMVAGVHFPVDDPPDQIARKLLRVNLSDLAAMGALPRGYTLAVALPYDLDEDWVSRFASGLATDQSEFNVSLLGGDTVATPGPVTLSLTALGVVQDQTVLRRNGARPGDDVYVSGTIGDAMLGLALIQGRIDIEAEADRNWLVDRFRLPDPRIALGRSLPGRASAAADISDGLVADLGHVCTASGCSAVVELEAVPLSAATERVVRNRQDFHHSLLSGGDDYELVFAVPRAMRDDIAQISRQVGIRLTRVGRFVEAGPLGPGVAVFGSDGNRIETGHGGYTHFGERPQD